jgi:pimeloyl-ACP methyl ester carboxylesterase
MSKFVELPNGLRMHYQESGTGPKVIVFVPGWTMTGDVFCRQLEFFEGSEDYRFIALDPRSHGKTIQTSHGNHYEQHGADLAEFIDALGLENVVLAGWSFATLATLSYVHQFGSLKLSGFIMLDGPPQATAKTPKQDWATYSWGDEDGSQEFFTMGKLRCPEKTNQQFARWMLEDETPEVIDWIVGMTEQTPNESAALLNAAANFLDYRDQLIKLGNTMPVWCIVRESQRDVVFTWCNKYLPSASLSAYGEHMMFWERAEQFNGDLLVFLETVKPTN